MCFKGTGLNKMQCWENYETGNSRKVYALLMYAWMYRVHVHSVGATCSQPVCLIDATGEHGGGGGEGSALTHFLLLSVPSGYLGWKCAQGKQIPNSPVFSSTIVDDPYVSIHVGMGLWRDCLSPFPMQPHKAQPWPVPIEVVSIPWVL